MPGSQQGVAHLIVTQTSESYPYVVPFNPYQNPVMSEVQEITFPIQRMCKRRLSIVTLDHMLRAWIEL